MIYTQADLRRAIESTIDKHSEAAVLWRSGDPIMHQHLGAIAQMAAMLSQQIHIGMMEPFEKARDTTVLADAALKGILPKSTPALVSVNWINHDDLPYTVQSNRHLYDSNGRYYEVVDPVTVPSKETGVVRLRQRQTRVIEHTVAYPEPFYSIEIPKPEGNRYISGIYVQDESGNPFKYSERFTNIGNGDRVFHVETDEYRRMYVRFGYGGVVGYQPATGEKLKLVIYETEGDVRPQLDSPFRLDYIYSTQDNRQDIKMSEVLEYGTFPADVPTLRELTRYPSVYDENAVFLGEFDFLIRRRIQGLTFLSVWNEQLEESVRGANVDNINRLFVSLATSSNYNQIVTEVTEVIKGADDSFRLSFIEPVLSPLSITINASIARIYHADAVGEEIANLLLSTYGVDSASSRIGLSIPQSKEVHALLKSSISALKDVGSDFNLSVSVPEPILPEHWHYTVKDSLSISVESANHSINRWGA